MPFTFAHPAAVLPFTALKKWVSVTGLVIGSMTPDFEFFFLFSVKGMYSHTLPGILFFDLPCAILLAFIFHVIVRNPLINHLPLALKSRLSPYLSFDWNGYFRKHFFVVIISVLIGVFSHLVWDSFTHDHGFFVNRIHLLQHKVVFYGWHFAVYDIVQYLSSLIGLLVVYVYIMQLPTDKNVVSGSMSKYWLTVSVITIAVLAVRISAIYKDFYLVIVTGMSGLFIGLIVASLLFRKPSAEALHS